MITGMKDRSLALLKTWIDQMLTLEVLNDNSRINHGLLCPSCLHIHGRVIDLIYPLMTLYDKTKNSVYLEKAKTLYEWGENLYCDDASYYNDAQQNWPYTTMFFLQSLYHCLKKYKQYLDDKTMKRWEKRFREISEWTYCNFDIHNGANTNYHAACCLSMAMSYDYFNESVFRDKAIEMKEYMELFINEEHFTFGEGKPRNLKTKSGCQAIDIGYGIEETLPCLVQAAMLLCDSTFLERLVLVAKTYSDFVLPDGAIDNSFGTRCFKWTYWGSRTSDGFIHTYAILSKKNPTFLAVSERSLSQLEKCTVNGYLFGGPHYLINGEAPCIHHMITHSKTLAEFIELDIDENEKHDIKNEEIIRFYESIKTYKVFKEKYTATVTGFDFSHYFGGHASGGTLTMLYHQDYGPVIASSNTDALDKEPLNTQLSLNKSCVDSNVARCWYDSDGLTYSNVYDLNCEMQNEGDVITSCFSYCDRKNKSDSSRKGKITYLFDRNSVKIIVLNKTNIPSFFSLPIICKYSNFLVEDGTEIICTGDNGTLKISADQKPLKIANGFNVSPGFQFKTFEFAVGNELKIELKF